MANFCTHCVHWKISILVPQIEIEAADPRALYVTIGVPYPSFWACCIQSDYPKGK
jgi:hypothetical protein